MKCIDCINLKYEKGGRGERTGRIVTHKVFCSKGLLRALNTGLTRNYTVDKFIVPKALTKERECFFGFEDECFIEEGSCCEAGTKCSYPCKEEGNING